MKFFSFLLCCLLHFKCATSLQCYQCKSTDKAGCLNKQKIVTCPEKQTGACMTLFYKTKRDNELKSRFSKSCWDNYDDCEKYCSLPGVVDDPKNCQVNCCTSDLCNAYGLKKQEVFQDKNRRSTDQNNSAARKTQTYGLFVFSMVSLVYHILNT